MTTPEAVLTGLLVFDLTMYMLTVFNHRRHVVILKRHIEAQRSHLAADKELIDAYGKQIELLWPFYRAAVPNAPAQPPHVAAQMVLAADSLRRQTEINNKKAD